jgi:hypothetical protein
MRCLHHHYHLEQFHQQIPVPLFQHHQLQLNSRHLLIRHYGPRYLHLLDH